MKNRNVSLGVLLAIGLTANGYTDTPIGLIGGTDASSDAYAAFILSGGVVEPITGLPASSQINHVAINDTGYGLIGGQASGTSGYAAYVYPDGTLHSLTLDLPTGTISATSINSSGNGIIGGLDQSMGAGYAALVASDGTINPIIGLPTSIAGIDSTAINDTGIILIGGEGSTTGPYAAYVTSGGTLQEITSLPTSGAQLYVALNDLGNGIIGGGFGFNPTYAAFVSPGGGDPTAILSPIPSGSGANINSVAINHSGVGIIGGIDEAGNLYAGRATPDGTVTTLLGGELQGQIYSVALNDSGVALVGGINIDFLYAALIQPDNTVQVLLGDSTLGIIDSVALNKYGVGLIGSHYTSGPYTALVAPNGALTELLPESGGIIYSVAINDAIGTANATIPQSTGPYSSAFYTHLSVAAALNTRFIEQNRLWTKGKRSETTVVQNELLASNNPNLAPKTKKQNTIWIEPFGDYVHLKAQGSLPSYTNEIGGVLLAYDHQNSNYMVGATAGYAYNYISVSEGLGHGKLQEEMVSIYGAYYLDHFWLDGALWGGMYELSNTRHTLSFITSKGSTYGWILDPHLEMASPWALDKKELYFIEPFFMLDWVNAWQTHYTETGAAGFNLQIGNLYSSLLQSEVGLRFYERFEYKWGDFCLEEKLSYVNQAPFHVNSEMTSFVASASAFPIAVASNQVENLGSVQVIGSFVPQNKSVPYGGFALQATANGSYQSYFVSVFSGMDF